MKSPDIKEGRNPPVPVVRSFVVSLKPAKELWEQWQKKRQTKLHSLVFYLGLKGEENQPRLTLLGGKIRSGEPIEEATQREVTEEGNFTPLGLPKQSVIGQWFYQIPSSEDSRLVNLTYFPVEPADNQIAFGDPKIKGVIVLDYPQLEELIKEGKITLKINEGEKTISLEEHLTINPPNEFTGDKQVQKKSLKKSLRWMEHIERYLNKKIRELLQKSNSEREFEAKYAKLISYFMHQGLRYSLLNQKEREKKPESKDIFESLNQGFLGRDILYYLPELAKSTNPLEWPGFPEASEGVRVFTDFLRGILDTFLKKENLDLSGLSEFMLDEQKTLKSKVTLINKLNELFQKELKEKYHFTYEEIQEAIEISQSFLSYLSLELKNADEGLRQLYQDFALLNEVKNANLGRLLLLFLGVDTKENIVKTNQLKFEAGRQLLLFLKTLSWLRYYNEHKAAIKESGRFQLALDNFFGPASADNKIQLQFQAKTQKFITQYRQWQDNPIIIEEKPLPKAPDSFLRKSFFEKYGKIFDFLSVNIIFPSPTTNAEERLNKIEELKSEFIKYLQEQYPQSKIKIIQEKEYGIPTFRSESKQNQFKGRRPGSQSNRFIRYKLIIQIDNELLELIIYPFINMNEIDKSGFFMGWQEKINDDQDYLIRRVLASSHGIPSLYFLLYPPSIYPEHYLQKMKSRYHHD